MKIKNIKPKLHKIILLTLIVLSAACLSLITGCEKQEVPEFTSSTPVKCGHNDAMSAQYIVFDSKHVPQVFFDKYVVNYTFHSEKNQKHSETTSEALIDLEMNVYSIDDLSVINHIHLTKDTPPLNGEYDIVPESWGLWFADVTDDYVHIFLNQNGHMADNRLFINLTNGDMVLDSWEHFLSLHPSNAKSKFAQEGNCFYESATNLLEKNGYDIDFNINNNYDGSVYYEIGFSKDYAITNNTLFDNIGLYPEELGPEEYVVCVIDGNDGYDNLVECLFGDESNVNWDGTVLHADASIDKTEHVLNSLEDFSKWYKYGEYGNLRY